MTQFNIGDTVYRAHAGQEAVWVTCPECLGSGRLRVILGDDSEVSIHCVCCERGYEGSPGKIQTYEFRSEVQEGTITAIELRNEVLRYSWNGWSTQDVFAARDEALIRAQGLVLEHEAEETKRLRYKEKQTKTWASNISYWRGEIRRAKKTIARCEARLAVAPKNLKEADNV